MFVKTTVYVASQRREDLLATCDGLSPSRSERDLFADTPLAGGCDD
jgi:hypothetical protein